MTSEQRVLARTARGTRYVWVKESGKRNEAWDGAVYALFAAHALDLHRYTEAMWRRLRERVAPMQADLLTPVAVQAPAAPFDSRETPQPAPGSTPSAATNRPDDGFGRGGWNERF
jgi:phage terminase large subunit GpA-like protein